MTAWSGPAAAAVAIVLTLIAVGQPVWEWRTTDPATIEVWSYGVFEVQHRVTNRTTNATTSEVVGYVDLMAQPAMAAVFVGIGKWIVLSLVAAIGGIGLSVPAALRRVRGLYGGLTLLAACALSLYAAVELLLEIPAAATADLAGTLGQPLPSFNGQAFAPGGSTSVTWGPAVGWFLFLGMGIAFAWGASEVWHLQAAKKGVPTAAATKEPAPAPASVPPPPADLVRVTPKEPLIDEVFVIAPSGLLIKHMSRTLMHDKDRDVVGGMISVVSNFVKEAFSERDGQVQEVNLGDHRFVICNGGGVVLAVLVREGDTEDVQHRLRHLLALLADRYGDRLHRWDGEPLEGLEDELQVLWEPFFVPPPPDE